MLQTEDTKTAATSGKKTCYVGIVAWNKLADSCKDRLKKGSAVLIDGELQSRTFKTEDGKNRTIVEIKAKRIQFLNKVAKSGNGDDVVAESDDADYEDNSFDKFLTDEESDLMKDKS
ncbi:MAG: single-stranded DNA-binding protein [Melioribacteraceae bacterium]